MAFTMYRLANSKSYNYDTTTDKVNNKDGVDAVEFWTTNKVLIISPTVLNSLSVVLLGLIYVMGK